MKGKTNNPHGRPKGTPNRTTKEIREAITGFINNNLESLQTDFEQLEPKDRLAFFDKLLQYALPKLQSVEVTDEVADYSCLDRLTNDELELFASLQQKMQMEHGGD